MTRKEFKLLVKYLGSFIGITFILVGIVLWALIRNGYIVIY